jgi:hypothetical protein
LAIHYCNSCQKRYEGKKIPLEEVIRTCHGCYRYLFTILEILEEGKRVVGTQYYHYYCPKCGEICIDCAEEKKSFFGSSKICKNCRSKVNMLEA